MKLEYFAHFIRCMYPKVDLTNDESLMLGKEFKEYLINKNIKEEILNKMWNISPLNIITNQTHPLKIKGYDPAFILHFTEFIELKKKLIQ